MTEIVSPSPDTPELGAVDLLILVPAGEIKDKIMFDVPPGAGGLLMTDLIGSVQANNSAQRSIFSIAAGALQAAIVKQSSEMDTEESRAISGVMATPIGGPTNAQK